MKRAAVPLLTWFTFLIAAVSLAARFVPVVNHAVLFLAAFSPYLSLLAGVLALPVLFTSWRWAAVPTLVLVAVMALLRSLPGSGSHAVGAADVPVRILTANVFEGAADPAALIATARERVDVLVLQELTPELAQSLGALDSEFPFRAVQARPHAAGVGIWSRYPIATTNRNPNFELGMVTASLRVPGASSEVTVSTVHLVGPSPQLIDGWRDEIARLSQIMTAAADANGTGAVIVAGDLNATADMQPFRRLLTNGFADAGVARFLRTWPANSSVPPLLGIDHILTHNSATTDVQTVRIPGSDHLGLSATVHIPG